MKYLAHVERDESVSFSSGPVIGATIKVIGQQQVIELSQAEWNEYVAQMATHDIKFDTVKQRLIATPRETMPLSGDQSD